MFREQILVYYGPFYSGDGLVVVGVAMTLRELQQLIERMYSSKDRARGSAATFLWFTEEVGELAAALGGGTHQQKASEFADVLAWLTTLANVENVDLTEAVQQKYGAGCPGCGEYVCVCDSKGAPPCPTVGG